MRKVLGVDLHYIPPQAVYNHVGYGKGQLKTVGVTCKVDMWAMFTLKCIDEFVIRRFLD